MANPTIRKPRNGDQRPGRPSATPSGKRLLRRMLPWLGLLVLLAAGRPGAFGRSRSSSKPPWCPPPLTVRVSEEGKTRVRNRYVVAAPVAGKMRRVPLKPGDEVEAGKTVLTTIEPVAAPLLDPRARDAGRGRRFHARGAAQTSRRIAGGRAFRPETRRGRTRPRPLGANAAARSPSPIATALETEASIKAADVRAAEFSLKSIDFEFAQARAVLDAPGRRAGGQSRWK